MKKITNKGCKGCVYQHFIYNNLPYCSYIFDTGKKRPCPPGEGCTVKLTRKQKRKKSDKT